MSKLIITTENKTFAIYDLKSKIQTFVKKRLRKLESPQLAKSGRPTYREFGIETDKKNLYIASHEKIAVFDIKTYKFQSFLPVKSFVNTHQILKIDNIIYIANAANDTIGIFDLKNKTSKYLDVKNLKIVNTAQETDHADKYDTCHVNSLYSYNGKIYFCLHNRGDRPSGYYFYDPSTEKVKHFTSEGYYGHGIVIIKNDLYTLASGSGELLKINLKTKKASWYDIADEFIFLRGLVEHKGKLLIGNSWHTKSSKLVKAYISEFDPVTEVNTPIIYLKKGDIIYDIKVLP